MPALVFFDAEIGVDDHKIHDIGAVREDGGVFHSPSVRDFLAFIADCDFLCGHNIIHHDLKYLLPLCGTPPTARPIDTLHLSPLLFPKRPYHALLKDDKLQTEELNNPVNDSKKARDLFFDEVNAFAALPETRKRIHHALLAGREEFHGFFQYLGFAPPSPDLPALIHADFAGKICAHADLEPLIAGHPAALAYALALIGTNDPCSVTPPWLLHNVPEIGNIIKVLRNSPCPEGCDYCREALNIHKGLREIFGFGAFRTYNGEPLQEQAARAAVAGKSLLAIFPTGGGKSVTFQLPALMAGRNAHALTVVISPLQSLMKDQVDNLEAQGIVEAVTVNGLLDPVTRKNAYERIQNGTAALLYIAPEMLRSRTLEAMLLSRNIERFVIDEAHCFSAWGQDFRVDYLFIGDFIRGLQEKKAGGRTPRSIPVSCFTATAKRKVISDIRDYFKRTLDLELDLFASAAERENLRYAVLHQESEADKYATLRRLIEEKGCPTIVYVSRTKRAEQLAEKLVRDGIPARAFHGRMQAAEKIANQEAFIANEVQVIVATSAFGMGVDKKDVGLVIHHDISDSLENYVQEAGRAGRDPDMRADCYVLYSDGDLDKHFILLNQSKLSISEIQQVWKAIKDMSGRRVALRCSALELARQAGWDDSAAGEMETRVKSAVAALESAGYVRRGYNVPRIYADSINAKNMTEAARRIDASPLFTDETERRTAKRIVKSLISSRSVARAGKEDAESRVDYLADILGLEKDEVVHAVNLMRQDGLLADASDMSAWIRREDSAGKAATQALRFADLEHFVLSRLRDEEDSELNLKECNEAAHKAGLAAAGLRNIRTILAWLAVKGAIQKEENAGAGVVRVTPKSPLRLLRDQCRFRSELCGFIIRELFRRGAEQASAMSAPRPDATDVAEDREVQFSLKGLLEAWRNAPKTLWSGPEAAQAAQTDVEDALLFLAKTGVLQLEGGFLVVYNTMDLKRLVRNNRRMYNKEDYRQLNEFYRQRIQQIHIVGEYANLMVKDYDAALGFVRAYFQMDYREFLKTYFKDERADEISLNISPEKYRRIFADLSDIQARIIRDADSRRIVVAAGPGSGKTRILVHKLASLLMLEDVKHEQLLMLTFSRPAATEFKKRLIGLVGNAAHFVTINTFHSYCFDLLGRVGKEQDLKHVVRDAVRLIESGEAEPGKIAKSVLVIDEAQDMDADEFALVRALMRANERMRVIAVGDDDQNIYAFRGSDSRWLRSLVEEHGAVQYEMTANYRSRAAVVALANRFVTRIPGRMKSTPAQAAREGQGRVRLVRHRGEHMEEAVAREAEALVAADAGRVGVLTLTNNEALQVTELLRRRGVRAKLIQADDGFKLYDLAEVRFFLKKINEERTSPVIDDALWDKAKARLEDAYAQSVCLGNCRNMIAEFEAAHPEGRRITDLEDFIRESDYEDFHGSGRAAVTVATIHKAKGREFDAVCMLLNRVDAGNVEKLRLLYVGMTRARDALVMHCNNGLFDGDKGPGMERLEDRAIHPELEEIALSLTLGDVYLSFFKGKKDLIFRVPSGAALAIDLPYLRAKLGESGRPVRVAQFSRGCLEKLETQRRRGYVPYAAEARFVVAWKDENMERETAVLLPNVYLRKQHFRSIRQ